MHLDVATVNTAPRLASQGRCTAIDHVTQGPPGLRRQARAVTL